jgi:hypothetical protein
MDRTLGGRLAACQGSARRQVVGSSDSLFDANRAAYELLKDAGNPDLAFVSFAGGHEYRQGDVEAMYLWLRRFDRGIR